MLKRPTRLELHRLRHRFHSGRTELLAFSALSEQERRLISNELLRAIHLNPGRDPYELIGEVWMEWGIRCHHPQAKRLYEGRERSIFHSTLFRWFFCETCECHVLNDDRDRRHATFVK